MPRHLAPALLLSLLPLVALPVLARAGAWTQPVGGHYLKASWLALEADHRLDAGGERAPADPSGAAYRSRQLFVYGEYGWRDGLTALGSWSWGEQSLGEGGSRYGTRSPGDLRAGLRWSTPWARPSTPVSLQVVASLPTYPRSDLARDPAVREQYLPAGSGFAQLEAVLQLGRSLWPLPLYLSTELGTRLRGGSYREQLVGSLELGGGGPALGGKLELRARLAPGGGEAEAVGAVAVADEELRLAPGLSARLRGGLRLELGADFLLWGREQLDAPQWQLGLAWTGRGPGG